MYYSIKSSNSNVIRFDCLQPRHPVNVSTVWIFPLQKVYIAHKKRSSKTFLYWDVHTFPAFSFTWLNHVLMPKPKQTNRDRLDGIAWNLHQIEIRIFFKSIGKNPIQISWWIASILDDTKKNWMKLDVAICFEWYCCHFFFNVVCLFVCRAIHYITFIL